MQPLSLAKWEDARRKMWLFLVFPLYSEKFQDTLVRGKGWEGRQWFGVDSDKAKAMCLRPSTPLSPLAGWLSLSLFNFYLFFGWGFMGPLSFFKALMNLLQYCFCFFMLWIFSCKACRIFAPWPGIEPVHCVLEGKVLTMGPPGTSPWLSLWISLPRETRSTSMRQGLLRS